ncbi:hypothetical protein, partial [Mesorhizobium sp. M7A.F.Ca.US.006.01.1.1]|uniref:NADPH-dependent F420 reductase n=1 Tax=Mesorhizobium sp. M7A.F.Ca.US.006.01.1.1 TaxID=2496707 RepID=UPI001FE0CA05
SLQGCRARGHDRQFARTRVFGGPVGGNRRAGNCDRRCCPRPGGRGRLRSFKQNPSLPRELFASTPADVVVIDTTNYYPQQRDGHLDGIEDGSTESEWVEQHLGRPVIKAFNTIEATHFQPGAKSAGSADRIALAVAGDDVRTKAKAMALIDGIGFDAVDAGTIAESWRQQPGSPGYLKDYDVKGVRRALAEANPERQPEWRATPNSPGTYDSPA